MKDSIVNEVMEMVDTFLSLVTIEDELDRTVSGSIYFWNGKWDSSKGVPYTRGCPSLDGSYWY